MTNVPPPKCPVGSCQITFLGQDPTQGENIHIGRVSRRLASSYPEDKAGWHAAHVKIYNERRISRGQEPIVPGEPTPPRPVSVNKTLTPEDLREKKRVAQEKYRLNNREKRSEAAKMSQARGKARKEGLTDPEEVEERAIVLREMSRKPKEGRDKSEDVGKVGGEGRGRGRSVGSEKKAPKPRVLKRVVMDANGERVKVVSKPRVLKRVVPDGVAVKEKGPAGKLRRVSRPVEARVDNNAALETIQDMDPVSNHRGGSPYSNHEKDAHSNHEKDAYSNHEKDSCSNHEKNSYSNHEKDSCSNHEKDSYSNHEKDSYSNHDLDLNSGVQQSSLGSFDTSPTVRPFTGPVRPTRIIKINGWATFSRLESVAVLAKNDNLSAPDMLSGSIWEPTNDLVFEKIGNARGNKAAAVQADFEDSAEIHMDVEEGSFDCNRKVPIADQESGGESAEVVSKESEKAKFAEPLREILFIATSL